jgi:hypothetical protein
MTATATIVERTAARLTSRVPNAILHDAGYKKMLTLLQGDEPFTMNFYEPRIIYRTILQYLYIRVSIPLEYSVVKGHADHNVYFNIIVFFYYFNTE